VNVGSTRRHDSSVPAIGISELDGSLFTSLRYATGRANIGPTGFPGNTNDMTAAHDHRRR
jgi:hypothetical protein